jgi:hypothetical protein
MIHEDVWQKECLKRLDVNSDAYKDSSQYKDTQRRAFTRAKKSLKDKDIILIHSDYVWFMVDT